MRKASEHSDLYYRQCAREWCEFATETKLQALSVVPVPRGRLANDPVYRWITEGRDKGPSYSSCADLAHWLLYRLGIRSAFVNRTEHLGYSPIVNVARLCRRPIGTSPVARRPFPREELLTGDVIIAWAKPDTTDAHVMIVDSLVEGELRTWDGGQGPIDPAAWRGGRQHIEVCRRVRKAWWSGGALHLQGGKVVQSILSLAEAIHFATSNGELADLDAPTAERLDELESWTT